MLIYTLFQNSQGKSVLYFIRFISTEKWVGCKHFKSYIFEVFADKHGQVAGDSMTRSRQSSGGSRLLTKALQEDTWQLGYLYKVTYRYSKNLTHY